MVIGAVSVWLRAVPETIWSWIVDQTTMMITVKDDDAAFTWVKEWFLEQRFLKRIRQLDLDTTVRNERTENTRERTGRRVESLTFRTIGRQRSILERFVDEVVQCHLKRQGVESHLYMYDDGWDHVEGYSPRMLDSVVLEPGEKEHLLQDMTQFRRSKKRYAHLGVPYHRGYLFYGPPGTGKTSLVSALAAHFGLSIYTVSLADFTDRSLMAAVNEVPANSVLLFEDIDCMRSSQSRTPETAGGKTQPENKEGSSRNGVTLSGLLNALDGFHAPNGVLFVMTTNHVEKLDGALLRPGRIDYRLYLGDATEEQKIDLYLRFFPEAAEVEARQFVQVHDDVKTMAEFQGALLALAERDRTGGSIREKAEAPCTEEQEAMPAVL